MTDDTTLDGTFPTNSNAGLGNWVIATAVPEPSTTALLATAAAATLLIAGRQGRSRMYGVATA